MNDENTIHGHIVGNFKHSRDFMLDFFGLGASAFCALEGYVKVLAALRALPTQAMDEIARPIMTGLFAEMGFDPKEDRDKAEPYADIFALAIQDATGMIIQNMEHQSKATAAIRAGRGSMLL
jgi:hypothetical protein